MSALAFVIAACSSGGGDAAPAPVPTATAVPIATSVPKDTPTAGDVIPTDAEVDPKTATFLGIEIHRSLWNTRPSDNYQFGFQWNTGDFAYQKANVDVRVIKNELKEVVWDATAVKTDGTEPPGFVVPDKPDKDDYYTIDGLFDLILDALNAGPANVSLGFDSVFGFPTLAVIEFLPGSDHKDVSFFAANLIEIPGPPR